MTELQFLIDLLLNHKLPRGTKKLVADRISVVENGLIPPPRILTNHMPPRIQTALLPDAPPSPMVAAPPLPKADIDKETGRAVVATGNGTRGPRKF